MMRACLGIAVLLAGCDRSEPAFSSPPPPATEPVSPPSDGVMRPLDQTLTRIPDAVSARYVFSLSADRRALTIDPRRDEPVRRAARDQHGFSTQDSANGGKIITLAAGPFATGAWETTTLRTRIGDAGRLDQLARAGYDLDESRHLLVVAAEGDPAPTTFAFSGDAATPGLVGICSDVTILDFGKPDPRPLVVRKPVVYLQPEVPTRVQVRLDVDGGLATSYPAHGDHGWTVDADPSGELRDVATGRMHEYLFWEANSDDFAIDRTRAHAVPGPKSAAFLEQLCDRYAMTPAQCGDFVTYWLPALERNPYSVIELVDDARFAEYAGLHVKPQPDTVIRLFMIFTRSDTPVAVGAPEIAQRSRHGFTVLEWGGTNLDERVTNERVTTHNPTHNTAR